VVLKIGIPGGLHSNFVTAIVFPVVMTFFRPLLRQLFLAAANIVLIGWLHAVNLLVANPKNHAVVAR
jgi:hypothetical protein